MEETIQKVLDYGATYGLSILAAVVIFIVGKWIARIISNAIDKLLIKQKVDPSLSSFAKNLIYYALVAFVAIAALSKLGIQTASFIAVLGAAGLAVGMALQGSLSNFAAGVMILVFRPFKVGDFVSAGGAAGTVKEIQIFNTILGSPDNVKVIVPNAQITSGDIKNYSANSTRRVDLVIGVSYSDDLQKTRKVLEEVLASEAAVLKDPAPTIAVSELADSSVNFVVRPWVKSGDYWPTYFSLTEKIKNELDRNGISIPFPQRDIHVINESQGAAAPVTA